MKNHLHYLTLLFFSVSATYAQINTNIEYGEQPQQNKKDILTAAVPQRGIYKSFQELRQNAPSGGENFEVKLNRGYVSSYQIKYTEVKKKEKKAYGFSDGQYIYINARNYGNRNYYVRIQEKGSYCFFVDEMQSGGLSIGGGVAIGPVSIGSGGGTRAKALTLDLKTGAIEVLNKKRMKTLLRKTPKLLNAYATEKQKNNLEVLRDYIVKFNATKEGQK